MGMQMWRRLPHQWIENGGLREFTWRDGAGADNAAALMLLAALIHHADVETGYARLTYDRWQHLTGLSRAKVSRGLSILAGRGIIHRPNPRRSEVQLVNFDAPTWAKFPARPLYGSSGEIKFFHKLTLRGRVQLDLLKIWFLFCSRRNKSTYEVNLTYDKIESYSGIDRPRIADAISLGVHYQLIVVERSFDAAIGRVSNSYRVRYVDPYVHAGTAPRIETPEVPF